MSRFGVRVYKEYLHFAAAHFLIFADGRREELHGHNYHVQVRLTGALGPGEMVLDMGRLKPIIQRHCDALDHRVLLPTRHPRLAVCAAGDGVEAVFARLDGGADRFLFPAADVRLLPLANTSAELLARLLAEEVLADLRAEAPEVQVGSLEIEVEESRGQCGLYETDGVGPADEG